MDPKRRSSTYISRPSSKQGHVVKGGQLARIRVDATGRMIIVVAGSLTLQVVSLNKGEAHTIASEKELARVVGLLKELARVVGLLKELFAVPTVESVNEKWRASLAAPAPENGGVTD